MIGIVSFILEVLAARYAYSAYALGFVVLVIFLTDKKLRGSIR